MTLPNEFQPIAATQKAKKPRKCEPESWVKDKIKEVIAQEAPDAWTYMPVQSEEGVHGIPDHILCVPLRVTEDMVGQVLPVFVGVEAKADDGKVSATQKDCHRKMRAAAAFVLVIKGRAGVARLRQWLRELVNASG